MINDVASVFYLSKVLHSSFDNEVRSVLHMTNDVIDESLSLIFVENVVPESTRLREVIAVVKIVSIDVAAGTERRWSCRAALLRTAETVWEIVRGSALVVIRHWTVALVVHRRYDLRKNNRNES